MWYNSLITASADNLKYVPIEFQFSRSSVQKKQKKKKSLKIGNVVFAVKERMNDLLLNFAVAEV